MTQFRKATKYESRLRMAIDGPSGAGKTYTSLSIAKHLGGKVAVIDTERGSASKYADIFDFDVLELESFNPNIYIQAIKTAESAGYDVLIIDSLSHAWSGKGGALELVDAAAKRMNNPNSFAAWREVTPLHNQLVDAILQAKLHIIVTMRSKMGWVVEADAKGKQSPRKVGMEPIQRDGIEYEFDVVGDMNLDNDLVVNKSRCSDLAGQVYAKPGKEIAAVLTAWLKGEAPPVVTPTPSNGSNPETVNVDTSTGEIMDTGPTCAIHGDSVAQRKRKDNGQDVWVHQMPDKTWCQTPVEPPTQPGLAEQLSE